MPPLHSLATNIDFLRVGITEAQLSFTVHSVVVISSQHVINVIGNNAAHWSFLSETDHTRSSAVPVRYSMTRRRAFISSIVITDTTTKYATCCLASQSSTFTCRKGYPTSHAPLVIYANLYSPITW